jgi:hypothetical protein
LDLKQQQKKNKINTPPPCPIVMKKINVDKICAPPMTNADDDPDDAGAAKNKIVQKNDKINCSLSPSLEDSHHQKLSRINATLNKLTIGIGVPCTNSPPVGLAFSFPSVPCITPTSTSSISINQQQVSDFFFLFIFLFLCGRRRLLFPFSFFQFCKNLLWKSLGPFTQKKFFPQQLLTVE